WGARRRVGFAAGGRRLALTDAVPLPASPRHQIDEYLMLAERCEAHADDTRPVLAPPPTDAAERVEARALLDAAGARRGRPAVGVHLGAAYGPAKTWPAERVVDGCRLLDDAGPRAVLLAVPPGDRFEAKAREAGLTLLDGVHLRARLAPLEIARDAARLRRVVREHSVDVLHAHHSHDHWLAVLARPAVDGRRPPVAR